MDKRALSAIPRPILTDKNKELLLMVPNMCYLATSTRQEVNGTDTLIINFFRAREKNLEPAFRTFCQPEDYITQDLTVQKTKWKTGAINRLTGYLYWYRNGGNIVLASVEDRETMLGFLMEFKERHGIKDYQRYIPDGAVVDTEIEDRIDEYQETIKRWKLEKRHKKEKDEIDVQMAKFGGLPDEYGRFVEETVFREENYIFYSLPQKSAYCTKCRHSFEIDDKKHLFSKQFSVWNDEDTVKHKHIVRCPWCNAYLDCRSEGMSRQCLTAIEWSVLIQKSGEDILVRYFRHIKDFKEDFRNPRIKDKELFRTVHTAEKSADYEWDCFKNTAEVRWCNHKDRSYGCFPLSEYNVPRRTFLYNTDLKEAVSGTCMKYSAIDIYVEKVLPMDESMSKAWFVDWYFNAYRKSPFLEQILKVGFYRMAQEFLENRDVTKLTGGKSILDTLNITKNQYNMLRRIGDPHIRDLEILRYKPDLTWEQFETLRYIKDFRYSEMYKKYADLMRYTTLHKLTRYIDEQKIIHDNDYFDYTGWTEKMGYDMCSEFNLFPRNFKKAHDERSEEYIKFKDKQAREETKRFNRLLKKLRNETSEIEAMNLAVSGMFIRLPAKLEELKKEGECLHHCVGTYQEKVREGKTMIFFIRRIDEPHKPFYTLEWNNNKVVQCRGFRNCDMTPEVKAFVTLFEQKMQDSIKKGDTHGRKKGKDLQSA